GQKENVFRTATGTSDNAIRPTNRPHEIERMIVVGEILNRVMKRLGERSFFRIHANTLTLRRGVSSILLPFFSLRLRTKASMGVNRRKFSITGVLTVSDVDFA